MTTTAPVDELSPSATAALDRAIDELRAGAAAWAQLTVKQRAKVVAQTHAAIGTQAQRWALTAAQAKNVPAGPWVGEEWMSGPYAALASFDTVGRSLRALAKGRSPIDGVRSRTVAGGRIALQMLPEDAKQWVLLNGFSAQLWLRPGVTLDQARASAGLGARTQGVNGGVGLVLGAGNISSIAPLDALYGLVAYNRASIVKLNPTFASLQPVLTDALAPLVALGVVRFVNGAGNVGGYLAQHPGIDHVHITGSGVTHDAIVWGTGEEAKRRRAARDPLLRKPISSELGGVSPIIVVPGRWSKRDLRFQAEQVVTQRLHNSGHNCIAGQLLILSSDWPQREAFLAAIRDVLDRLPSRTPWYPGAPARLAAAQTAYPAAESHGDGTRLLVDIGATPDLCTTEYFAPVFGHTSLPGTGAAFLSAAVGFANERLAGTLGASVVVRPKDRTAMGSAFDDAIADLRYGGIAINAWTGVNFFVPGLAWGGFPGGTLEEIGSGIGVVHNARLLADTERSVVTGPFRPFPRSVLTGEFSLSPRPPWFVTARTQDVTASRMTRFATKPSWRRIPAVVAAAFRG